MQRHNSWMSYSFNDIEYKRKGSKTDKFSLNFKVKSDKLLTYKNALLNNGKVLRDSFSEPFDVCLSGGTDSEIVVRVFKELGITHNTYIFKCENNYNIRDVNNATELCEELNIPYKIVDFNLQHFYENDAESLLKKTWIPAAGRLPRLKFIEYLDNIPVFCDGEPYWRRVLQDDYSNKSDWLFYLTEDAYSVSIYSRVINRVVIGDWYEFTPDILLSFVNLSYVEKLFNDEIVGKTSTISSKAIIHKEFFPTMRYKQKLIGYEGLDGSPGSRPQFISEFYYKFMSDIVNTTFTYNIKDLKKLLF